MNIKGTNVNMEAFKDFKTAAEVRNEPSKLFQHLSESEQHDAYSELISALNLNESVADPETDHGDIHE